VNRAAFKFVWYAFRFTIIISSIAIAKKWQKTACKIFKKKGRYLLETWEQAGGNPFSLISNIM
jgi:hypothetical protein